MIPESYDQWVHCITVKCSIPLTADYVDGRLAELRDAEDPRTVKFRGMYGDEHWRRVIGWFERSLSERAASGR